jgi:hypothetical protein
MTVSGTVEYHIWYGPTGQKFVIPADAVEVPVPAWAEPFIAPLNPDVTIDVEI